MEGKNIPLEEQKKFLEQKLSEEEIAEVFKRIGNKTA
jgi:phenylalanyl-tRNA synthetase beta subunit